MLPRISLIHLRNSIIYQVRSSLSFFPLKYHQYIIFALFSDSPSSSKFSNTVRNTHLEPTPVPHLGKLVYSKCSHLWDQRVDKFTIASSSLYQLILNVSYVCPETCRKFLRVSSWEPKHVLEFLLNFQLSSENSQINVGVVESLWDIFRRFCDQNVGFKHLPRTCEIMAFMLINVGMFREVEFLLSTMKTQGISLANDEIFNSLIKGYVDLGATERALLMYDTMRGLSLAPSLSCYRSLIGLLMKEGEVDRLFCVYEDVIEVGFELGEVETKHLDNLIEFLCWDGKIREARKLLKRVMATGWKPTARVLSAIADVYYKKKDFEDLLSFFIEMKCAPDILLGNKSIYSICSDFGVERANSFLWGLEKLGFIPNEMTFGIIISWCCVDGEIREAFVYLSEIFSRGLKPDRRSYNALISGLFKAGMPEYAREILHEMIDNGLKPDFATFRALLAGYSKARLFNEVELMMHEMVNYDLILLSPSEKSLSKAFSVLGLNPLAVKVMRDNDVRNFRTEFVDALGNGLYLDTDIDEFEKTLLGVLEESLIPDFNLLMIWQSESKKVQEALLIVDEMLQWGQEPSHSVLFSLVRLLGESNCIKAMRALLDIVFQFFGKLDYETLNYVVVMLSKNGIVDQCRLLHEMHIRKLPIFNATHSAALVAMCKLGSTSDLLYCWGLARKDGWSPKWNDFIVVLESLCHRRMLKELLELFDIMVAFNPDLVIQVCDVFLEKLSSSGFTVVGHIMVNELKQEFELDDSVYSCLLKGYCQEKRFSEALRMFDKILADSIALSPNALLLLIPKLCKVKRFQEVVALKDTGFKDDPSILFSLHSALVISCCKAGLVAEADVLFLEMFLKNMHPNDEMIDALLQVHCQSSDLKTAKEIFCVMMKRNIILSLSSYRDLLFLFCSYGLFHSAWGLKNLMLVGNNTLFSIIHNILIFSLFQTRKYILVDLLLDELQESGQQLDEVGYNFLVHGFSVCKDIPRSMTFLNNMISKGLRPSNRSLRAVIKNLCRTGQVQNALRLSNQIEATGWIPCSTVHYEILESLFSDGSISQAERLLARIMEKGLTSESIYCNSLIRKFCQYGRLETAVNLLNQILKKKSIPDTSSYDYIVRSFCGCDNLERAMDFFNEMLHRNFKPSTGTWDLIIQKFCNNGQTVEAESVLNLMINVGETPTKGMYLSLIDRYRLEQNLFKATELMGRMQQDGYEPDFITQWSLISNLSNSNDQKSNNDTKGFLSKLLVKSGFPSETKKSKLK